MPNDAVMRRLLGAKAELDRSSRTDRDLLRQFADCGDESAFEALVKRHTNLVLGVCRRSLANGQDAEDACQAVFLILAKKAKSERWQASIANWLYSTARKVSRKARLAAERRVKREGQAERFAIPSSVSLLDQMTGRELLAAIDDELERLPAIYREPLVLCQLEGLSRNEAAIRLGVGPGTMKIRLERGRKKLADALTKRDFDVGSGLIAIAATSTAEACSPRLMESILAAVSGSPSASVAVIAKGIAMNGFALKTKLVAFAAVAVTVTGFGLASLPMATGPQTPAAARTKQTTKNEVAKSNDKSKTEQPTAKADEPPKYEPLDPETVAAYEKLGAKYEFNVLDHFSAAFPESNEVSQGLPGFSFVFDYPKEGLPKRLPKLPPVKVPFGLLLNHTYVTDEGLKELKDLKSLVMLALSSTRVTDEGLNELKGLRNLAFLDLSYTNVTDAGLKELKNFKNLTALYLHLTKVTDAGMKELKDFKNLAALNLRETTVTDVGLEELKDLKNLIELDLAGTKVTDAGLNELKDLKNLARLMLSKTKVTDAGMKVLKPVKNLVRLYLGYTDVTDAGMKELKDFKNLTGLELSGTKVTDAGLKKLNDLENLTALWLNDTDVTDAGLKELKKHKNLTNLILRKTMVSDAGMKELKDLRNLTMLLIGKTMVTDAGLKELKNLKNLTDLDLEDTKVTDAGLKELNDLENLTGLWLSDTGVTDAGLKELKNHKNLRYVGLRGTKVTDTGLRELREALPKCAIEH